MGLVYKVGNNWEDIRSYWEVDKKDPQMMFPYDGLCPVFITDRMKAQVMIIRSGNKYGVYTGDHTNGTGGPGTWCNPTDAPFPYDEVKFYADPLARYFIPALFPFRIGSRWGIIEVIDGEEVTTEKYDAEYPLTKRRILVPCKYRSLHEAEAQLGKTYKWESPIFNEALGDFSDADGGIAQCVRELIESGYKMENLPLRMFKRKTNTSNMPTWNSESWLAQFKTASRNRDGSVLHSLRIDVYKNTLACVNAAAYMSASGKQVKLGLTTISDSHTRFYSAPFRVNAGINVPGHIEVVKGDCLEFAKTLTEPLQRGEVTVLNMANRQNPGGGVLGGAGAQEEYLFRCSDYYRFLYRYREYASQYGLPRAQESYPMDRNFGGIFSRGVTVFRGPEEEGYPLLDTPWRVNFVAVAGINRPMTVTVGGEPRLTDEMARGNMNKIRTILRIAIDNGQRVLVLGALGCGAFRNPPKHMAELFLESLHEDEFKGAFDAVYFAIKNDHNSQVNYDIFKKVIG